MKQDEYLMIGGVSDGKTISLKSPTPFVQVPVLAQNACDLRAPVEKTERFCVQQYRREILRTGDRTYYVYVYDDIPGSDVIGRLIAGYGGRWARAERLK